MDHHPPTQQTFFPRCDPPPLHARCIPVFGTDPSDGDGSHAPNVDYYLSNVDHQLQQQHDLQMHHGTYEAPEEYRSQAYAYYAPCGPPYYVGTETGGPNAVGVPGMHTAGLDLPMRIDVNMTSFVQRPASSASPIYEAQHITTAAPCGSVGLPLAPEQWAGQTSVIGPPPMLHKAREAFEMPEQHHLGIQHHSSVEERAGFEWPPLPQVNPVANSMFGCHFHPGNGNFDKDQDQAMVEQRELGLKMKTRSTRVSRSKAKKELHNSGGPGPKFQCFLCAKQYCRRR